MAEGGKGIEAVVGLACGAVWLAFTLAGTDCSVFEPAITTVVGALGLEATVRAGFQKFGVESPATLDAVRKEARLAVERLPAFVDKFGIDAADDALARTLENCFLSRDALVQAALDKDGFPTRATRLVMTELARVTPDVFGENGAQAGIVYAREVVHAALKAAVETPEYFAKLQPHFELLQLQSLAQLLELNGDVKAWLMRMDAKLDQILAILLASGGMTRAAAAGLSEKSIRNLLTAFALEDVPLDQAEALLLKAAAELKDLKERLSRLSNEDDPDITSNLTLAKAAIEADDYAKADMFLAKAETADMEAGHLRIEAGQRRILRAANTMAERASLALAQARLSEAAEHYGRAAITAAPYNGDVAWACWFLQADTLIKQGQLFPGLDSFRSAANILKTRCVPLASQLGRVDDWATALNRLGNALQILGERTSGAERLTVLDEALAAYQAALEVRTKTESPTIWAEILCNIANTLRIAGDHKGGEEGLAALREAILSYNLALEVCTRDTMPMQWASIQNNLGNAFQMLGEHVIGEEKKKLFDDAVTAFRAALEIYSFESSPVGWASAQNNLGIALRLFGESSSGNVAISALNRAVDACRAALKVRTREKMPADWAQTQNNLGTVLWRLSERSYFPSKQAFLYGSVEAYRSALEVYTIVLMPTDWAMVQHNLGNALAEIGENLPEDSGLIFLHQSIAAYEAALRVYTYEEMPVDWVVTQNALGGVWISLGLRSEGERRRSAYSNAFMAFKSVVESFSDNDVSFYKGISQQNYKSALEAVNRFPP